MNSVSVSQTNRATMVDRYIYFVVLLITYSLPILLVFNRVLLHPFTMYVGDNIDSAQFVWYLGWFWHAVLSGQNPFISYAMNAPWGINLMDNTSIMTEAVLFGPLIYLTNGIFVFNLLFALAFIGSALAGSLIFRQLGFGRSVQMFVGILFEIMPFGTAQSVDGHINLVLGATFFLVIVNIVIYLFRRGLHRPALDGLALGITLSAEFYTSSEVFATTILIGVITVMTFLVLIGDVRRFVISLPLRFYSGLFLSAFILIIPGVWVAFFIGPFHGMATTDFMPRDIFVSDLGNLIIPGLEYLVHNQWSTALVSRMTGGWSEKDAYVGLFGVLLFCWSWRNERKNRYIQVLAIVTIIIFVLSLGPELHIIGVRTKVWLPWAFVQGLPLIGAALPSRLMMYADVFGLIVIAYGLFRSKARWALLAIAILILTWLPAILPSQVSSVSLSSKLEHRLGGHRTAVISTNYWYDGNWALLSATSHYRIPVTDVYSFPYNHDRILGKLDSSSLLISQDYRTLSPKQAQALLSKYLHNRKPQLVLYIGPRDKLPQSLYNALDKLCGSPSIAANTILWSVPTQSGTIG